MNQYIFITTEGSTYQPNSDSAEPDIENMQVIGFGQGHTVQNAFRNLIEQNEHLKNTKFNEIVALPLANDNRVYFSLKNAVLK